MRCTVLTSTGRPALARQTVVSLTRARRASRLPSSPRRASSRSSRCGSRHVCTYNRGLPELQWSAASVQPCVGWRAPRCAWWSARSISTGWTRRPGTVPRRQRRPRSESHAGGCRAQSNSSLIQRIAISFVRLCPLLPVVLGAPPITEPPEMGRGGHKAVAEVRREDPATQGATRRACPPMSSSPARKVAAGHALIMPQPPVGEADLLRASWSRPGSANVARPG
jgi:hypothetical protein